MSNSANTKQLRVMGWSSKGITHRVTGPLQVASCFLHPATLPISMAWQQTFQRMLRLVWDHPTFGFDVVWSDHPYGFGFDIWFWSSLWFLDLIIQSIFWSPTWSWLIADRLFLQYRCRDHHVPMSSLGKLGCRVMKHRKLATRTNSWWMQRISRKLEVQVAFRSWVRHRKSLAVPWCPWSCVFPWHNSDVYRSNKYRTNTEK